VIGGATLSGPVVWPALLREAGRTEAAVAQEAVAAAWSMELDG